MALPFLAGGLGAWATAGSVTDWYPTLVKPSFNPPAWVFGPVWTSLYFLMGLALFLVWERGRQTPGASWAMSLFGIQLGLNALWSVLFFGARSPGWALVDILLLWAALVWTVVLFFRVRKPAGWLLAPYLAWVTFAGVLNFAIWTLNR
jgi:tryptophan-rich sensory protein